VAMDLEHWWLSEPFRSEHYDQQTLPAAAAGLLAQQGTVLGVDAGGTGSRAVLIVNGTIERHYCGPPLNALLHGQAGTVLAELLLAHRVDAAGIGLPGIGRHAALGAQLATELETITDSRVRVATDSVVAWLGAFLGAPGIVVIGGTGSVAMGGYRPPLTQARGYGYLLGDEGSGYWIGNQGLRAALAAADHSGPPTALPEYLTSAAGCSLDELVVRIYQNPGDRLVLAQLAPVVAAAADTGNDPVAQQVIDSAAAELAGLAKMLTSQLGDLPVVGSGRVFRIRRIWNTFATLTGARHPAVPPEIGAALLATL
jgi:glucosamine kinase